MSSPFSEFTRGWRPLLAAGIGTGAGVTGLSFYGFGVFVLPLVAAFGWTRGEVSAAASFLILGSAITSPIVGSVIDRFGARRVGIASLLALSAAYAALTTLQGSLAMFYVSWLLLALLGGGTTPVVWTRTVNLWFDRGRGLALGLALAGSGIASMLAPPLLTRVIAHYGWQTAYLAMGTFLLIVATPLVALLLDERPADRLEASDKDSTSSSHTSAASALPGVGFAEALRSVTFWKIGIGFFFVSAVVAALIINLVPLLIDRGLTPTAAAATAGMMGIAVLIGRVATGYLLDRYSASAIAGLVLGSCALGCVVLAMPDSSGWMLTISVLALGLAAAAEVDLVAYLSSRFFGLRAYGKIYGWQLTSFYLGAAGGPLAAGLAFDAFGSYTPMLAFATAALLMGAMVMATLGKPRYAASG
jgi:MFS family permease